MVPHQTGLSTPPAGPCRRGQSLFQHSYPCPAHRESLLLDRPHVRRHFQGWRNPLLQYRPHRVDADVRSHRHDRRSLNHLQAHHLRLLSPGSTGACKVSGGHAHLGGAALALHCYLVLYGELGGGCWEVFFEFTLCICEFLPPHQTAGVMITVYYRHRLPNSIQPCRRRLQQRAKRRHPNCLPRPARHDLLHGLPAARGEHEAPGIQVDILGAATNLLPRSANGKSTRRRIHQMLRNRPNPRHPIRKHHKQRFSLPPIKSQGTSDRVLTHDFSSLAHGGCQTRHRIRLGHRLPPRILGPLTCKMRGVTLAQWWPSQLAT